MRSECERILELLKAQYQEGRGDPAVNGREEQERVRVERKLSALEWEIKRLVDAYQAEVLDLSELKARRQQVEERGRMLKVLVPIILAEGALTRDREGTDESGAGAPTPRRIGGLLSEHSGYP